jgi:hypothetical protein
MTDSAIKPIIRAMRFRDWTKQAQQNGWLVRSTSGAELVLMCGAAGCDGCLRLPMANLGPVPDPCDKLHVNGAGNALWEDYRALVDDMRRRRRVLGLSQEDVNNAMGMADGYVNKLEALDRIPRPHVLQLWAQTLGLRLTAVPTELPAATLRIIDERQKKPYAEHQARFKFG